jgi:hypothetical protein
VEVTRDMARFRVVEGDSVALNIYGQDRQITAEGLEVKLPQ